MEKLTIFKVYHKFSKMKLCHLLWASPSPKPGLQYQKNLHYLTEYMMSSLSSGVRGQQRRRSACESAQSDQRLCYSFIEKYHIKACYKRNFTILTSLCR